MNKITVILFCLSLFTLFSCFDKKKFDEEAFIVVHSPNPSNINKSEFFPEPMFPYTWYYSTEIKNTSDRELKIIWFEGYSEDNGFWYGSNILNKTLRNEVFQKWYGNNRNNPAPEWIKPGETRTCNPNWHGSYDKKGYKVKWAFIAIDKYGNDYYSESIIETVPIK